MKFIMITKLFLDDKREAPDESWQVVKSYEEFFKYIDDYGVPDVISFDHDLHPEHSSNKMYTTPEIYNQLYDTFTVKTGLHAAQHLIDYCEKNGTQLPTKIYIHSANPVGKMNIFTYLKTVSFSTFGTNINCESVEYEDYFA